MAYEIVGDTELVGDAVDEILRGTSYGQEIVGKARGARVVETAPRRLQRLPLGIGITSLATLTAAVVTVTPQVPFKLERFISQSTGLSITDIKVGTNSQFVGSGAIPIEIFGRDAVGIDLKGDTAVPGVDIALAASNGTGGTLTLAGAYVGLAAN
jgi:hypothetical protein